MNPKKADWAHDLDAPRQEINTLSLLYEEASIQELLAFAPDGSSSLRPDTFLDAYRKAREDSRNGRQSLTPSVSETARLTQDVSLFGAKAAARARHPSRIRGLLSCICPDRVGVLAELSKLIASEGGNIEGAVMAIVAGHLVSVFVVSGIREEMKRVPDDLTVQFMELKAEDVDWPRPGSTAWQAKAALRGDAELLLELTAQIAALQLPLMTLASSRGPDPESKSGALETVELSFAVAPDPTGDELETIRRLEDAVADRLPKVQLDIVPATWPTPYRSQERGSGQRQRDLVMTVVGHAQPGFVNRVIRTVVEIPAVVELRGSSMAILEGMTVLTLVLRRDKPSSPSDVERQIRRQVTRALMTAYPKTEPPQIQIVHGTTSSPPETSGVIDPSKPTHELRLQVVEQPGVIAKVSALLARREVNITWFVTQVGEPVVGERWPTCDIQMQLNMPEDKEGEVSAELRSLSQREGWAQASLREWSLAR